MPRCHWAEGSPLYRDYHDKEWGKPQWDSQKLFEQLCLEGQQAGLSWITVLNKREAYRQAFYRFDPAKIAQMSGQEIEDCLHNAGLIRHRAKLEAIVKNAKAYLAMVENGESFSHFIWQFVHHCPQINRVTSPDEVPTKTAVSKAMSKALKQKGFVFVGETTCYAFMQAVGMVDDHYADCEWKSGRS